MKKIVFLLSFLCLAIGIQAKTLIVYYSYTNNVKTIVNELSSQIEADVVEIQPAVKGLDYAANNYAKREKLSLVKFPPNRLDVRSLFESLLPYFDAGAKPDDYILKLKMMEGIYAILKTGESLYASLFDFVEPWKMDIADFMEQNFMNDLSREEMAYYTGRSLATFKRDFKKISELTPQKWLIRRRLEAARDLIRKGGRKVSEICFDVGFKNLSHFSKLYKETYGMAPTYS